MGAPADSRHGLARPTQAHALSPGQKVQVREVLNSLPLQDYTQRQVYATLLDEGTFTCSVSSLYRIRYGNLDLADKTRAFVLTFRGILATRRTTCLTLSKCNCITLARHKGLGVQGTRWKDIATPQSQLAST